jgi:hypothetical protein
LGFLALALRGIQLGDLWAALRAANFWWVIPAILVTAALLFLKAWRWQLLFLPEHRLRYSSVLTALCAGYLASNVFPARLGEVVRLVLLVSDEPVSASRTFSTIVVERLLDVLTLLVIMLPLLPFVELPAGMARGALLLGAVALLGAGVMVLCSFRKAQALEFVGRVLQRVRFLNRPGVISALEHLIDGFAALRGRMGLLLVAISLLGWVGVVFMAWSSAQAFRLDAPLTAMVFAVVVTTLGMLVPSSPGYVGVFHYLVTVALAPFGIGKELALSFALVWHGINYLTLSASGVVALAVHGTSLGAVVSKWRGRALKDEG